MSLAYEQMLHSGGEGGGTECSTVYTTLVWNMKNFFSFYNKDFMKTINSIKLLFN